MDSTSRTGPRASIWKSLSPSSRAPLCAKSANRDTPATGSSRNKAGGRLVCLRDELEPPSDLAWRCHRRSGLAVKVRRAGHRRRCLDRVPRPRPRRARRRCGDCRVVAVLQPGSVGRAPRRRRSADRLARVGLARRRQVHPGVDSLVQRPAPRVGAGRRAGGDAWPGSGPPPRDDSRGHPFDVRRNDTRKDRRRDRQRRRAVHVAMDRHAGGSPLGSGRRRAAACPSVGKSSCVGGGSRRTEAGRRAAVAGEHARHVETGQAGRSRAVRELARVPRSRSHWSHPRPADRHRLVVSSPD